MARHVRERPLLLSFACIVAATVGALAAVVPIAAGILAATLLGAGDPGEAIGRGLAAMAIVNVLVFAVPLGLLGLALLASAVTAMRGSRKAWAATTALLSVFAVVLVLAAAAVQLYVLAAATVCALVCLVLPRSRGWYRRRAELEIVDVG